MTVFLPRDLDEALELRSHYPEATPIAGGTDLCVHWPERVAHGASNWLDLSGVPQLRGHEWSDDALRLASGCTYLDVIRDPAIGTELPLLVEAARRVGALQIQSRGTWGGNIVNASPAADGVLALMAYDAAVEIRSVRGDTVIPLREFYLGYKEMRLESDELVTGIRVPRRSRDFEWLEKVGSRSAQAITKVGAAVTRHGDDWRVVANSVAPTVCRCPSVEDLLSSGQPVESPEDLKPSLERDVAPIDDIRSTAAYRGEVLARLLYWGLRDAAPSFT